MGFQPFPTSLAKNLHPSPHATGINFQEIGNLLGRVSFQQAANGKEPTVLEFSWQAFASHPGNDTTCQVADITFVRRYKAGTPAKSLLRSTRSCAAAWVGFCCRSVA